MKMAHMGRKQRIELQSGPSHTTDPDPEPAPALDEAILQSEVRHKMRFHSLKPIITMEEIEKSSTILTDAVCTIQNRN